jgi:hypothetical protein
MTYFLIFVICFIAAAGISVAIKNNKIKGLVKQMAQNGYSPNNIIEFQDNVIGLNIDTNRLSIANIKDKNIVNLQFDSIRDYEIQKNGLTVYKKSGTVGRAIVGGLLFGGVGAIAGAATSKSKGREKIESANFKLFTNDFNNPAVIVKIFDKNQHDKIKDKLLNNAQLMADKLAIVIEKQASV